MNVHYIILLSHKAHARTFQSKNNTDVILEVLLHYVKEISFSCPFIFIVQYWTKETGLMLFFLFHTSSAGKNTKLYGFAVVGYFELLLLYPFILFSSRAQSSRDTRLSVPIIMALTTSVYVVKLVRLLCWNAEMTVNTHQICPQLRAVYRERAADCPPTLPGLIELICACPAAHSARQKMQKTAGNWEDELKKKKGVTGWVGGKKWRPSWRKRQKEAGWEVNEAIRRNRELNDLVVAERQTKN